MESEKKYQWNPYFANPIAHTNIDLVVSELEIIKEINGSITPQSVIDSARNKTSVLHSYFNWDDKEAANQHRLTQARKLLRHIEVRVITDGKAKTIRVYQTVSDAVSINVGKDQYKNYSVISDSDNKQIVRRLIADLRQIKTRLERVERVERVDAIKYILQAILVLETSISEETEQNKRSVSSLTAVLERNEADSRALQGTV